MRLCPELKLTIKDLRHIWCLFPVGSAEVSLRAVNKFLPFAPVSPEPEVFFLFFSYSAAIFANITYCVCVFMQPQNLPESLVLTSCLTLFIQFIMFPSCTDVFALVYTTLSKPVSAHITSFHLTMQPCYLY